MPSNRVEEFRDRFERTSTPCIIRGCTRKWAARNWTFEDFYTRFGRDEWAVGEGVRLPLDKYLKYGTTTSDDSPVRWVASVMWVIKLVCGVGGWGAVPPLRLCLPALVPSVE